MTGAPAIHKGMLLVSEPFMLDPNFKRSVVLICEHTNVGTTGFVINKVLDVSIHDIIKDFPDCQAKVIYGGPVAMDTIHYLHTMGDLVEGSQRVVDGVYWGGDFTKLKFLIENEIIRDDQICFFVGYSGWTEGQLEDELKDGSWIASEMDPNYLFKLPPNAIWQKVLDNMGNAYSVIARTADNFHNN